MNKDRLKTIIAALLNESGRTEPEMEAAKAKAAELMTKHGLTAEEILAEEPDMLRSKNTYKRHSWIVVKIIGMHIAELTGTQCWYESLRHPKTGRRTDNTEWNFAGYRPDVENAQWIMDTILMAGTYATHGMTTDKFKSDVLYAFSRTIAVRLRKLVEAMEKVEVVGNGRDLMATKDGVISDYLKNKHDITLRKGQSSARSSVGSNAAAIGQKAGESVNFSRPVGANSQRMISS